IYQQTEKFATFSETIIGSVKGMLNEPVIPFLNHIHQPCLVIFGENDQLIPNRFVHPLMNVHVIGDIARQKIRKAAVHYFSQCGHYVPFEKPHEFSDELRQFFLSTED
ncbi:MAG TPA: alpha/beta hydrolase, partial [Bacteroidia bacterium]|nr:alpha/beta hydrolase [Bacteroidia bacterium]